MARKDSALDKNSLEHPNAFMASDGRTMYKYEMEDKSIVVLPKPLEEMREQDFYNLPITVFDQQPGRLPQNLTVVFKDPQWAGHWFNKKAGNANRVGVARTLGFVPAKIQDLETYFAGLNDQDGAVEQNDLVLMKIHKAKLYLRFAEWIQIAKQKGSIGGYKDEATRGLGAHKEDHISYYHTPQALKEFQGLGTAPNE